jgi:RAQPRD family integrative conjugative element protein
MCHRSRRLIVCSLLLAQGLLSTSVHAVNFMDDPALSPSWAPREVTPAASATTAPLVLPAHSAPAPVPAIKRLDNVDAEREQLANLSQELTYLRQQVMAASKKAPGASRVQFRYDWLDRDLELIQRGIQDHMDAPRQPRTVIPLKGAYRR